MSHEDGNFDNQMRVIAEDEEVQDSDPVSEDPMDIADEMEDTEDTNAFTPLKRCQVSSGTPSVEPTVR